MSNKRYPTALTIAGSDSSGGAGIQADLKSIAAQGVYGASVITAITAQNTQGVHAIAGLSPEMILAQGRAVLSDLTVHAIKIGMLHDEPTILAVGQLLSEYPHIPVVTDPVMVATSGDRLLKEGCLEAYRTHIFPRTTLLTPNLEEAALLAGLKVSSVEEMEQAALSIFDLGIEAVLIKGGHLSSTQKTDMLFVRNQAPVSFVAKHIDTCNTHGTGCTLSASIAAHLALGKSLSEACQVAKDYLHGALEAGAGVQVGQGHGPVNHHYQPQKLQPVCMK